MGNKIASSAEAASQKKAEILSSLDEYVSFDGVSPADHDDRASRYQGALSQYASSLSRDADALEQIGLTFQEGDESVARSLLGIGG